MTQSTLDGNHRYTDLSQVHEWTHQQFLRRAETEGDRRCRIVIAPAQDHPFLRGIALANDRGFVEPILVGNERRIRQVADEAGIALNADWRIIHEPEPMGAVARAASLIKRDEADTLMRGRILVYDFFKVLFHPEHGLRDRKQFWSQLGVLQIPGVVALSERHKSLGVWTDGDPVSFPGRWQPVRLVAGAPRQTWRDAPEAARPSATLDQLHHP